MKHMKRTQLLALFILIPFVGFGQFFKQSEPFAHTYSIVAFDPETGDMGAAVQSHWFSVGTLVIWGEAGVGVVATQSFINASFGPRGLDLLKQGLSPQEALDSLLSTDEGREVRQVAILNNKGEVAAFTGKNCIQAAGHYVGEGYSVQANLMEKETVWPAMAKAFENTKAPLAERMMTAMEAAQNEGGDMRGKQSAAMIVVRAKPTGNVWEDRLVDIRIDDHATPIIEMKRILNVLRAYEHMNAGDLAIEKNQIELAQKEYAIAQQMMPENEEMKFWTAVTLANIGKMKEALPIFKTVFEKNQNWKLLTPRLVPAGLLTVSDKDLKRILAVDQ